VRPSLLNVLSILFLPLFRTVAPHSLLLLFSVLFNLKVFLLYIPYSGTCSQTPPQQEKRRATSMSGTDVWVYQFL